MRELTTAVQKTRINRGQAKETTLKAGLDRDYAPELVGSRLLYIVQQYEDMKKLKEDTLANEVAERKAKVTSALNSAKKLSDAAEEAWVEKEAEWQRERVTLLAKLDNEGKTAKKTAEEEKAELQAELTRQRESAEAAAMKQFRADKEELEALRSKLKENRYEVCVGPPGPRTVSLDFLMFGCVCSVYCVHCARSSLPPVARFNEQGIT